MRIASCGWPRWTMRRSGRWRFKVSVEFGRSYSPQTFRRAEVTDVLYRGAVRHRISRSQGLSADVWRKPHTDSILWRHSNEPPCLTIRGLHKVETQAAGHRDPRSRIINHLMLRPRSSTNLRVEYNWLRRCRCICCKYYCQWLTAANRFHSRNRQDIVTWKMVVYASHVLIIPFARLRT